MARNYTPILDDWLEEMGELSDAEYGRLIRWCQHYNITGEAEKPCGNERFYAKRCLNYIDKVNDSYAETTEKRRKAGEAGAQKRWGSIANDSKAIDDMASDSKNGYSKSKSESKSKSNTPKGVNNRRFTPPTPEEVKAYCQERNNGVDADRFVDYYTSKGWKVGNQPMKDWKAAVRTWERSGYNNAPAQTDSTFTPGSAELAAIEAMKRRRGNVV